MAVKLLKIKCAYLQEGTVKQSVLTDLQNYALDPFIYDNLLHNFDDRINDGEQYALFYKIFDMLELDPNGEHVDPASPIKSFAGGQLKQRKPRIEAARIKQSVASEFPVSE